MGERREVRRGGHTLEEGNRKSEQLCMYVCMYVGMYVCVCNTTVCDGHQG